MQNSRAYENYTRMKIIQNFKNTPSHAVRPSDLVIVHYKFNWAPSPLLVDHFTMSNGAYFPQTQNILEVT